MKALIFGANGQDGYYLAELCRQKSIEPIGVSRSGNLLIGSGIPYSISQTMYSLDWKLSVNLPELAAMIMEAY